MRILIVEDDSTLRLGIRRILQAAGWQVDACENGEEALRVAPTHDYAAAVLDLGLPRMDGLTFARHVRNHPVHKFTPIIMLTTESQESKKEEGKAAGAKAWVVKPFKPEVLLGAVAKLVLP